MFECLPCQRNGDCSYETINAYMQLFLYLEITLIFMRRIFIVVLPDLSIFAFFDCLTVFLALQCLFSPLISFEYN